MTTQINEKNIKWLILLGVIVFLIVILIRMGPVYTLNEVDQAIVTRFGNPIRTVTDAGLHFKMPGIDRVNVLPKHTLSWDGEVQQFPTYDKEWIQIDTTARWRISDPILFYEQLNNVTNAMRNLDSFLDSASREVVSRNSFHEVVRVSNRIKELDEETVKLLEEQGVKQEELDLKPVINKGRDELTKEMQNFAAKELKNRGIELVSMYIKKINYVDENLGAVYDQMISERKRIAQAYRSQGEQLRLEILGDIDQQVKTILSEAELEARTIRGKADAEATNLYNQSYNRNNSTRDFYEFMKKMEMYKNTPSNASLIISTDSEFFNFFKRYK